MSTIGVLQIGLLDPIMMMFRAMGTFFSPLLDATIGSAGGVTEELGAGTFLTDALPENSWHKRHLYRTASADAFALHPAGHYLTIRAKEPAAGKGEPWKKDNRSDRKRTCRSMRSRHHPNAPRGAGRSFAMPKQGRERIQTRFRDAEHPTTYHFDFTSSIFPGHLSL